MDHRFKTFSPTFRDHLVTVYFAVWAAPTELFPISVAFWIGVGSNPSDNRGAPVEHRISRLSTVAPQELRRSAEACYRGTLLYLRWATTTLAEQPVATIDWGVK